MWQMSKRLKIYYAFAIGYFIFLILFLNAIKTNKGDTHTNAIAILRLYKKLVHEMNENAETDISGLYKILYSRNLKKSSKVDVELVSQCSANYITLIKDLKEAWKGPVSVAVYFEAENLEKNLWEFAMFKHCSGYKDLRLHIVVPIQDEFIKDYEYGQKRFALSDRSISCKIESEHTKQQNYNGTSSYPINLLRNVAKSGSNSEYILVVDIDMIPSHNLRSHFLSFIDNHPLSSESQVYVIPAFEVPEKGSIPQNKIELMKSVEKNQARPFYFVPCRNCQKYTKYGDWLSAKTAYGTKVLYEVEWVHPWEPFFISKISAPDFDERFKQYGMNRVSQICEIYVAGYKFSVLDNVFLVHRGYKTGEGFHRTKNKEMEDNRRLYGRFKSELKYKYPGSKRTC